jgi:signal transduction histidine kinase/Tfp pilus assembly protein PilF
LRFSIDLVIKMRYLLFFLSCILLCKGSPLSAQGLSEAARHRIDSLRLLLPNAEEDRKVYLMNQLGRIYESYVADSSLYFAEKALQIAEKYNDDSGMIVSNHQIGDFYQSKRNYLRAFVHYKEAYDLMLSHQKNHGEEATLSRKLGFNYFMRGDYPNALVMYEKALTMNRNAHNEKEIAIILKNIGISHSEQQNQAKAEEYLLEAIETFKEMGDANGVASSSNNLAMIYIHAEKYEKALEHAHHALAIREKANDESGVANAITVIGRIYMSQKQFSKALQYFNIALQTRLETNDKYNIAYLDNYLSDIFLQQKQHHKSIHYAQKSLQLFLESGIKTGVAHAYELLYKNHEALEDFKQALHFQKLNATYRDSLMNEEKARAVANLEAKFEIALKEREIFEHKQQNEILAKENALHEAKIEEQYVIGIAILGALLTFIFLAIFLYRLHLKDIHTNQLIQFQKSHIEAQAKKLEEANAIISANNLDLSQTVKQQTLELKTINDELDTFMYHTSHDLRQPLVNFIGLVEVAKISLKDVDSLHLFGLVRQIADRMDNMLHKMQVISDIHTLSSPLEWVDVSDVVDEISSSYEKELKNIDYQVNNSLQMPILSNQYLLHIIFKNLVENSIDFRKKNDAYLHLDIKEHDNQLLISVKDNGEGVHESLQEKIFEMYFRGSESSKGNGLGLYIVKKAIQRLGGEISLQSELGKGATFALSLPLIKEEVNPNV